MLGKVYMVSINVFRINIQKQPFKIYILSVLKQNEIETFYQLY